VTESPPSGEDDRARLLERRFATLEEASRNLSLDVQALTETLKVVSQLQVEQREQRRKQTELDEAIVQARRDAQERNARTRKTFLLGIGALAVILPLVSVLVYWSLLANVNQLLREQRATSYASCQTRNQSTADQAAREQALADAEKDQTLRVVHSRSAEQLRSGTVNCSKFK
jgi:hypothetical protein